MLNANYKTVIYRIILYKNINIFAKTINFVSIKIY